jgi:hypothetical protein
MIKKIHFVNDRSETQRGIQLKDGRIISLYDEDNHFYLRYDNPIYLNVDGGVFDDELYFDEDDEMYGHTLNGMIAAGLTEREEVHCYDEVEYFEDVYPDTINLTKDKIDKIVKFFKEKGYNVQSSAVEHNLSAWFADEKSGYRDEKNGYHLFSPCGCNALSIRLSTLHPLCEDWQTTYVY